MKKNKKLKRMSRKERDFWDNLILNALLKFKQ